MKSTATISAAAMFVRDRTTASPSLAGVTAVISTITPPLTAVFQVNGPQQRILRVFTCIRK